MRLALGTIVAAVCLLAPFCLSQAWANEPLQTQAAPDALRVSGAIEINEDNFPDPVLREYVHSFNFGGNFSDTWLTEAERENVEVIDLDGLEPIADLTGIELFPSVKQLDLSGGFFAHTFSSVDLSPFPLLEELYIDSGNVTVLDLTPAANLRILSCANIPLSSIDVGNAVNLDEIRFENVPLSSLSIGNNSALRLFRLSGSNISSLSLKGAPNIEVLDVGGNGDLSELHLADQQPSLTQLHASGTPLPSLALNAPNLEVLDISNTLVSSLSTIDMAALTSLREFHAVNTPVEGALDLSRNGNIAIVDVSGSLLSAVTLPDNPDSRAKLTYLGIGGLDYDAFDATPYPNLATLNCPNMENLVSIAAGSNDKLGLLNASNCPKLASLDLSSASSLHSLSINNTSLASLDIDACTKLDHLDISHSRLLGLDLSRNTTPFLAIVAVDHNLLWFHAKATGTMFPTAVAPVDHTLAEGAFDGTSFDLEKIAPGIDPARITGLQNARQDGSIITPIDPARPVQYQYNTGTFKHSVTIHAQKTASTIQIGEDLSREYDGSPTHDPRVETTGGGTVSISYFAIEDGVVGAQIAAPTLPGTYLVRARISGNDDFLPAETSQEFVISPRALHVSAATTLTYAYQGTTNAAVPSEDSFILDNAIEGDDVSLDLRQATAALDSPDAGARTLVVSGMGLAGEHAERYFVDTDAVAFQTTVTPAPLDTLHAETTLRRLTADASATMDLAALLPDDHGGNPFFSLVEFTEGNLTSCTVDANGMLEIIADGALGSKDDTVKAAVSGMLNYQDASIEISVSYEGPFSATIEGVTRLDEYFDGAQVQGFVGKPVARWNGGTYEGPFDISYKGTGNTAYGPSTDAPIDAGTYEVAISVPENIGEFTGSTTIPFEIAPAIIELTLEAQEIQTVYGEPLRFDIAISPIEGAGAGPCDLSIVDKGTGRTLGTVKADFNDTTTFSYQTAARDLSCETHEIAVKYPGSKNIAAAEAELMATVEKRSITPIMEGSRQKTYDGTPTAPADAFIAAQGALGSDNIALEGTIAFESAEAGTTTLRASGITFSDEAWQDWYTLASAEAATSAVIEPAQAPRAPENAIEIENGVACEADVPIADLLPRLEAPLAWGAGASMAIVDVDFSVDGYYDEESPARIEADRLVLPILSSDSDFEGTLGSIELEYRSNNFQPVQIVVDVVSKNGDAPSPQPDTDSNPDPKPDPKPESPFLDVASDAWYYDAVVTVWKAGLMRGIGETNLFDPEGATTRAQFAAVLHRVAGQQASSAQSCVSFVDVAVDMWHAGDIAWAAEAGVFVGYSDGTGRFGPDDVLTREQSALVLMRFAILNGEDVSARADLSEFSDEARISPWARDAVSWAVAKGLVLGIDREEGPLLDPQGTTSRAQLATLLERSFVSQESA